jgi:glucose-6-phosphate 1-dehydrogenase
VNRSEEVRDMYERMPYPTPLANLETLLPKLDMEFAQEGGKEPTLHEVLLHAALVGDNTRFIRQDDAKEPWRIMPAFLDAPPPVHSCAPASWGSLKAADQLVAGHGRWHGSWVTA